jgi:hypothetical protein
MIKEENEVLREKYVEILTQLQELNTDGRLVLNQKNLEKVALHLERGKVLKAAGVVLEDEVDKDDREKIDRRSKRKYITQNLNKRIIQNQLETEADMVMTTNQPLNTISDMQSVDLGTRDSYSPNAMLTDRFFLLPKE